MRRGAAAPPIPEGDQTSVGANPHGDAIFQRILRLLFFRRQVFFGMSWWVFWNDVSEGANGLIHNGTIICWYFLKLVSDSSLNCLLSFGLLMKFAENDNGCLKQTMETVLDLYAMDLRHWMEANCNLKMSWSKLHNQKKHGHTITSESIRLILRWSNVAIGNPSFDGFFSWEKCATHGGIS